jgi:hypothetical protein
MTAPQLRWLGNEWPADVLAEAPASLLGVAARACQPRASATEIDADDAVSLRKCLQLLQIALDHGRVQPV